MADRYLIVCKTFSGNGESYHPGDIADTRGWRNVRALLESGYLKSPSNLQEYHLIEDYAKQVEDKLKDKEPNTVPYNPAKKDKKDDTGGENEN